jgi:sulfur carrier protein
MITLNGKPHPLPVSVTVAELLDSLGLAGKPVVVERDPRALSPAEHATAIGAPGATLEVITLAAGG